MCYIVQRSDIFSQVTFLFLWTILFWTSFLDHSFLTIVFTFLLHIHEYFILIIEKIPNATAEIVLVHSLYYRHCWYIEPRNREKSLTLI